MREAALCVWVAGYRHCLGGAGMAFWRKGHLHVALERARSVGEHEFQGGGGRKATVTQTGDGSHGSSSGPG